MKAEQIRQMRHVLELIEEYSDDLNRGIRSVGAIDDIKTELDLTEHAMYKYLQEALGEDEPMIDNDGDKPPF